MDEQQEHSQQLTVTGRPAATMRMPAFAQAQGCGRATWWIELQHQILALRSANRRSQGTTA